FSQFDASVIDPLTGNAFPGNRIPRDRMSAVSLAMRDLYYPTPNRGDENTLSDNFEWVHPYSSDFYYTGNWPFVRVDHNLTENNSLYARWSQRRTPYVLVTTLPQFFWTRLRDHRRLVVADTHIFSSALVNTFRFGFNHDFLEDGVEADGQQPINGAEGVAVIGLQGVNPQGYDMAGFPRMEIPGVATLETVTGGVKSDDKDFTIDNSLSWTTGRHVWKFGVQYLTYELNEGVVPSYGDFLFNGVFTGQPYADFLLGIPFQSSRYDPLARRRTSSEVGLYAQDSFKVGPNLTIDYGVRWDYFTSTRYDDGLMYNWDEATGAVVVPEAALASVSPLYPNNITITTGDVIPTPDKGNFRPRVSAAYRFNDKTVLRGGYGSFTPRLDYFARAEGGGPFQISETYLNIVNPGSPPLFAFPNPFPASLASAEIPSQSINNAYPMQTDNGTIHQFNVSLERELWNIGFRASYIGSRSVGLNYQWVNINKPEPSSIPFTPDRRPWPQFVEIFEVREDGKEKYDAVQIEGRRRIGLVTFDAHYTWSRSLFNSTNLENPYDVTSHWSNDDVNRRHFAVVSTEWTLPIGQGMRYLGDASPLVDRLLGGWSIATVSYFASGNFFTPWFSGSDPSNTGTFGGVPDRVGLGNLQGGERTPERWFNADDFAVPSAGRFGNAAHNSLEGQGLSVHHRSISKRTPLAGSASFTFTVTASNLFNHPHFVAPNADITTPGVGQISAVMNDFSPEKAGRRMIMLRGSVAF
ncbi:MAG: TonB-dependent receptor domain-containing protein, partial [Vicinamibacteraceae bacterium]